MYEGTLAFGELINFDRSKMESRVITILILLMISSTHARRVRTTHGELEGFSETVLGQELDIFLGVPFAKPPIGDLRFKHPVSADPWSPRVFNASTEKPACQQKYGKLLTGQPLRVDLHEISEDCLYLNIWVPTNLTNGPLATMVWIYGGSFMRGTINTPLHNGKYLAASQNVIVASISYRVGALGFLYLSNDTFPGNQGLMDQSLGIKWIFNNIEQFGGDPDKITLFGESAGAASVGHHLLSPFSRGFFSRAILESGAPNARWASVSTTEGRQVTQRMAVVANCSTISDDAIFKCIHQLHPDTIVNLQTIINTGVDFAPVVDGYFLPSPPLTMIKNRAVEVDILLGVNKDEGTLFLASSLPATFPLTGVFNVTQTDLSNMIAVFSILLGDITKFPKAITAEYVSTEVESQRQPYQDIADDIMGDSFFKCPAADMAKDVSKTQNSFLYTFDHIIESLPVPKWMGVPHSYELEIIFGHPLSGNLTVTEEEIELTRTMMTYWANFAKTGNPNQPISPRLEWPRYDLRDEQYIQLNVGDKLQTKRGLRKRQCAFWNEIVPLLSQDTQPGGVTPSQPEETTKTSETTANGSDKVETRHCFVYLFAAYLLLHHL